MARSSPTEAPAIDDPKNFLTFWRFFSEVFCPMLNLALPLKPAHKSVCNALNDAYLGKLPQNIIVINIAPRIGKTKILEALVCWGMAYFPDSHIINTSYSAPLAEASTRFVFSIIQSEWYRTLFPWVRLGDVQRGHEFNTVQGGRVYGTGVSGSLTGFGGGLKRPAGGCIIIDDPANPKDALSPATAAELQFWFENVILRRRNSSEFTPVIIVAQRLAVDDLPGYVLENYGEQCLHLKFQVIDETRQISNFPETVSYDAAMKTKQMNPFAYFAQMQQEPVVLGGNLIKIDDFMRYDHTEEIKWQRKIITCDTAMKTKENNDWSVLQCWGKKDGKAYLIDHIRGKWESPELINMYRQFYHKHHRPGSIVYKATLEDKAAGTGLGQTLRREGMPVMPLQRNVDKVTRVKEILPYIATHMVYLPLNAPWMVELLSELAQFRADGKNKHDDQCFPEGTLITCKHGRVPIEEVTSGHEVLTRTGWARVLHGYATGIAVELVEITTKRGHTLRGTRNHPVYNPEKSTFNRLDTLVDGDTVLVCEYIKPLTPQTLSSSTGSSSEGIRTPSRSVIEDTTLPQQTTESWGLVRSIRRFGKLLTGPYLKIVRSITWMRTPSTTPSITSNVSPRKSIGEGTERDTEPRLNSHISQKSETARELGTQLPKEELGTAPTQRSHGLIDHERNALVWSAEQSSTPVLQLLSAPASAGASFDDLTDLVRHSTARIVGNPLASQQWIHTKEDQIVSVRRITTGITDVYNLKVQGSPEYFANGVLVHNCDALVDGVWMLLGKPLSIFDVLGSTKKKA